MSGDPCFLFRCMFLSGNVCPAQGTLDFSAVTLVSSFTLPRRAPVLTPLSSFSCLLSYGVYVRSQLAGYRERSNTTNAAYVQSPRLGTLWLLVGVYSYMAYFTSAIAGKLAHGDDWTQSER